MKTIKKIVISFLMLFAFTASISAQNDKLLKWNSSIKNGTLENGMSYYVLKNSHPENRILLRLVVKAGSNMEEDDQKGVAHFVEHMCFNGTENFKKSAIVDYFESIGMAFGPEVNAYTSFEETVYMLEIPADNPEILTKSLQVLRDWACSVTFEQEELDKERGVIKEEWRLNQGVSGRIRDSLVELILKDSKYAERLPIGDMKIIENISRDRVVDFYQKWYRPEFMSIVAVGDINPSVLEKEIKNTMNVISKSEEMVNHPDFLVPNSNEKVIKILKDKEMPNCEVDIFSRVEDYSQIRTEAQYRENISLTLFTYIFNQRLQEITNSPDAVWLLSGSGAIDYSKTSHYDYVNFVPKEGQLISSIKKMIDEYTRICNFGITDEELDRVKKLLLSNADLTLKNKNNISSSDLASQIVNGILYNIPVISTDNSVKLTKKFVNQITKEEILSDAQKHFKENGNRMLILLPENYKEKVSEKEILDIWKNYQNQEIENYTENKIKSSLMDKPAIKGKIISTEKNSNLGTTEYTFENGIKLICKKTKYEKDLIRINGFSRFGSNYFSEKEFPSSQIMLNYASLSGFGDFNNVELQKLLLDKQVSLNFNIFDTSNVIKGSSNNKDFEVLLQLINLSFTKPRFTDEGWKILMDNVNQIAKSHGSQPQDVFIDKILELVYGNDIRYSSLTPDFVSKFDKQTAEKLFREVFKNISDYTFIIVGDINEKKIVDLFASYLGSVPTEFNKKEPLFIPANLPTTKKEAIVKKGIDNQGYVDICFTGKCDITEENSFIEEELLNNLTSLLEIKLREIIREDKGGSYGVSVSSNLIGITDYEYIIEISFGCDPKRQNELQKSVLEVIDSIKKELVSDEYIQKLTETSKRNREVNLQNNNWILSMLGGIKFYTYIPDTVFKTDLVTNLITAEKMKEKANKFFNFDNVVTVYLKPEK